MQQAPTQRLIQFWMLSCAPFQSCKLLRQIKFVATCYYIQMRNNKWVDYVLSVATLGLS